MAGRNQKPKFKKIPHDRIGEGIILTLENSLRLVEDSLVLASQNRWQGAMTQSILAIEEFGKMMLLLAHYEKHEDIYPDEGKIYFVNHEIRLREFHMLFGVEIDMEQREQFANMLAISDKNKREELTYVDWNQFLWRDPMGLALLLQNNYHTDMWDEMRDSHIQLDYYFTISKLLFYIKLLLIKKKIIFDNVLYNQIPDIPTFMKINDMISKYVSHNDYPKEYQINDKWVKVKITKIDEKISLDDVKKIKNDLKIRYPSFKIRVHLAEKYENSYEEIDENRLNKIVNELFESGKDIDNVEKELKRMNWRPEIKLRVISDVTKLRNNIQI